MESRPRQIVIFGGSKFRPGDESWSVAEDLGRAIAERGWVLVNGGYGGAMHASSEGARDAGGEVIGVLCELFGAEGNPHLTRSVQTGDLYARLRELIDMGDAYITLPGSTGTLAELVLVWELINKRVMPLRPLLCLGNFWEPIIRHFDSETTFDSRLGSSDLPHSLVDLVTIVPTVSAAMQTLDRALASQALPR